MFKYIFQKLKFNIKNFFLYRRVFKKLIKKFNIDENIPYKIKVIDDYTILYELDTEIKIRIFNNNPRILIVDKNVPFIGLYILIWMSYNNIDNKFEALSKLEYFILDKIHGLLSNGLNKDNIKTMVLNKDNKYYIPIEREIIKTVLNYLYDVRH